MANTLSQITRKSKFFVNLYTCTLLIHDFTSLLKKMKIPPAFPALRNIHQRWKEIHTSWDSTFALQQRALN